MQTTTSWDTLAGQYRLHPGATPAIVGQRPVLGAGRLGQLLRGQRGEQVSSSLGNIFTLCSHAHRRTAALALAAAQKKPIFVSAALFEQVEDMTEVLDKMNESGGEAEAD